ncbi:YonK family protein [Alkalihalobacillus sp. NPDC078783]
MGKKAASKKVNTTTLKGLLSLEDMTVIENINDEDTPFSLIDILNEYAGKDVSITIKEENPLPTKDMD